MLPVGLKAFLTMYSRPTSGTRVVEFDVQLTSQQSKSWNGDRTIEVEMWDCSGSTQYEGCWPAIQKDCLGVVIVYNPENRTQSTEVETWYDWFVEKGGLKAEQCLVLANDRNSGHDDPRGSPPKTLEDSEIIFTDSESGEKIKSAFQEFLAVAGRYK